MEALAVRKHLTTPWLVDEFTLTSDTLEISVPKSDLGRNSSRREIILPLSKITSVETRSRFRPLKLLLGIFATLVGGFQLLEVVTGQPNLVASIVLTLLFLPAGLLLLSQAITGQFLISDESGKKQRIDFSIGDRDTVQAFADTVARAAADKGS